MARSDVVPAQGDVRVPARDRVRWSFVRIRVDQILTLSWKAPAADDADAAPGHRVRRRLEDRMGREVQTVLERDRDARRTAPTFAYGRTKAMW